MDKLLSDESLIQATMYFRFYLFMAMIKTGHGDMVLQQLRQWEDMLNLGLTTFAEKPEPTRSDCHAWSASPLYFFLSSVAGIMPAEPGFRSVLIEPRPGKLNTFKATMPHPSGPIVVDADYLDSEYAVFNITLPGELNGRLIWKNKGYTIKPGVNTIQTR
jgi:alpha-L-rhamnosidase